jgi:hypothetical protein
MPGISNTMPEISNLTKQVMAEIGADMTRCAFDVHRRLLACQALSGDSI